MSSPGSPRARRWRPTGRVVAGVVVALVAIALLLWGADRLARSAAESLLAGEVQRATGVFTTPEVELQGGSFLLQAVRGRYDRVDITVFGLSSGALRIERLDAELSGVRLPFHDLLLRNPDELLVERSVERARLDYADLNAYLEFTGRPYEVRPGQESDEVRIDGEVRVFGRDHDVTVDAVLGAEEGALTVAPSRLDTGSDLDRAAELLLGERFTFRIPLDPLPFGQQVTAVDARPDGLVVRAEGETVVVRP